MFGQNDRRQFAGMSHVSLHIDTLSIDLTVVFFSIMSQTQSISYNKFAVLFIQKCARQKIAIHFFDQTSEFISNYLR